MNAKSTCFINRWMRLARESSLALALLGLGVYGGVVAFGRPLLAALAAGWWVLVLLMADWHLGMLERPDGSRLPGLGVANTVTLLRAGAIPLLPALGPTELGLALVVAGLSDVIDGSLARARGETSRLGAWADGAVDALLIAVAAVAAAAHDLLPAWVAVLIVSRDVRELQAAGDVAGRVDVRHARPAAPVDADVTLVEVDAELLEAETGDAAAAPDREQESV